MQKPRMLPEYYIYHLVFAFQVVCLCLALSFRHFGGALANARS